MTMSVTVIPGHHRLPTSHLRAIAVELRRRWVFQGHQLARRAIAFSIAKLKQFVVDKMTWSRRTTLYEHTAEQGENNTLLRNIIIPASNSRTREIELKRVGPGE